MTLNAKIGVFMDFLAISSCKTHFDRKRIVPKSIEKDMDKLHIKFSALDIDFDGPSRDFLASRKPAHKGIKEQ